MVRSRAQTEGPSSAGMSGRTGDTVCGQQVPSGLQRALSVIGFSPQGAVLVDHQAANSPMLIWFPGYLRGPLDRRGEHVSHLEEGMLCIIRKFTCPCSLLAEENCVTENLVFPGGSGLSKLRKVDSTAVFFRIWVC